MENKIELFLDCGAPSIYNKMSRVTNLKMKGVMGSHLKDRHNDDFSYVDTAEFKEYRDGYIKFIKANEEFITVYPNLDVINNGELTYKNQKIIEEAGLHPIPVFHVGQDVMWLKKYLKEGYEYMAVGGIVPNPTPVIVPILDEIWDEYLTDDEGMPVIKVHGFGVTSVPLMLRYPWYSVDSTTWCVVSRNGGIITPPKNNAGEYDYTRKYNLIPVSEKSPKAAIEGQHFTNMPAGVQSAVLEYLDFKGFTIEEVSSDYKRRDQLNIHYFLDFEKSIPPWPIPFKHKVNKGFGL